MSAASKKKGTGDGARESGASEGETSIDSWMEKKNHPLEPWSVLGRQVHGVVSWNMNDVCNYRCSYCTQRHMGDRSGQLEDVETTLVT